MDKVEESLQQIEETIARRVRELRQARNWTLDNLAETTGLSKSYLSQIENSEKTPTIPTLTKIAYALRVNVQALLGEEAPLKEQKALSIVKATERRPIIQPGAGSCYNYESITYKRADRLMDGYLISVGFELPSEPFEHEGQEFVYVLEGTKEFIYDGQSYIVTAGDCLYFDSDRPHMSRSIGDRPAKFLVVFCNPQNQ